MKIQVTKWQRLWWSISAIALLGSLVAMGLSWSQLNAPLRPGLDFIGGTRLQLDKDCNIPNNCDQPIQTGVVRDILAESNLADSSIQVVEDYGLSIRTKTLDVNQRSNLIKQLEAELGTFDVEKTQIDTVGPTIGKELFISGFLALIVAFAGIIVYLTFRFQFDYAVFAILALFHDTLITMGVFAFLGLIGGIEVDSLFLVALLTIIGFSVNDTVVIYDRIRETQEQETELAINDVVDLSVNQTLSRSINTSITTILPLITIFFLGGETLKYFALALIVGFICGSYSSIFIASTLLGWWRNRRENQEKELTT